MRFGTKLFLLGLATMPAVAMAQSGMTPEAAAYLDQARQVMLQRDAGNPGFHLQASFTITTPSKDKSVAQAVSGRYEEWWLSPQEWRKDITLGAAHYSIGRKENQVWKMPAGAPFPVTVSKMISCVVPFIPTRVEQYVGPDSKMKEWKLKTVKLDGIELDRVGDPDHEPRSGKRSAPEYAMYFFPGKYLLVVQATGIGAIQFSKSAMLAGKVVLLQGSGLSANGERIDFKIDSMEGNPKPDSAIFAPPTGSEIFLANSLSSAVQIGKKIGGQSVSYPAIAKAAHVQGQVIIDVTMEPDGSLSEVRAVSGPPLLRQAAIEAVRTWRYQPTLIDGIPMAYETEINVNFTFSGG